jgi:hypothetical protein
MFKGAEGLPLTKKIELQMMLCGQDDLSYAMGRLTALPLPGLANHFPSEYERALRECLPCQGHRV